MKYNQDQKQIIKQMFNYFSTESFKTTTLDDAGKRKIKVKPGKLSKYLGISTTTLANILK